MQDYDSPWKEAVDTLFTWFVSFCFPWVMPDVDWTQDHEFLEQEMRKLIPEALTGKRLVDKLVKLTTKQGDVRYLHIEVQGDPDARFEERMDVYNARARDRFGQPVVSVAVLADDDAHWRPAEYRFSCWGCERTLTFPTFKVLDWAARETELEQHANPFALFVMAHMLSRRTRSDPEQRARAKLRLIRLLIARNLDVAEMQPWYRLLDWLLALPAEIDRGVWEQVSQDKEKAVPYITFAERYGMEKGYAKAMVEIIELMLSSRFGAEAEPLLGKIRQLTDADRLRRIVQAGNAGASLEELRLLVDDPPANNGNGGQP